MKDEQLGLELEQPRRRRGAALVAFHPRLETPAEALEGEARAVRQEDALLAWFRLHPGRRFAPSEVHELAGLTCPITSVRRALTNLTNRGELVHHPEDRRPGPSARGRARGPSSCDAVQRAAVLVRAPGHHLRFLDRRAASRTRARAGWPRARVPPGARGAGEENR